MFSESESDGSKSSGSKKDDEDKKASDFCNSSVGSDHSIQVKFRHCWHRTWLMIRKSSVIIFLILCVFCIALGVINSIGFSIQGAELSNLKQRVENTSVSRSLLQDINLKLKLLELHNKQSNATCSSTCPPLIETDSLMDLSMQIDEISTTQAEIKWQLNNVQSSLSNLDNQISVLQVDASKNISRLDAEQIKHWNLLENISEHLDNLSMTRDEHGDQLSSLRSSVSNFSIQLNSVDGRVTSLNSSMKSYKNGLLSLQSNFTTLTTQLTETNNVVSRQSATVQQRLSDLDDIVNSLQVRDDGTSIEFNALKKRVDQLEKRLRQNGAIITSHPTGLVIALSLLLQVFLIIIFAI